VLSVPKRKLVRDEQQIVTQAMVTVHGVLVMAAARRRRSSPKRRVHPKM
jgi:hypothetical protein